MHPEEPKSAEPDITLLSLSVQQLSAEARALRETIQRGRSNREAMVSLVLLGVIAVSVLALALHVLF